MGAGWMHGCGPFCCTTMPAAIGEWNGEDAVARGRAAGASCPHAAAVAATAASNSIAVSAWLADVDIFFRSDREAELQSITL